MLNGDCFANMSAPAPANTAKGSTTTKRSIPARLPHRPISPSSSSPLQKRSAMSSSSVASLASQRGKALTATRPLTATRSSVAPVLSHAANTKGLEAYLPRLQAAANRACPAAPSKAPPPLRGGSMKAPCLRSSPVKASIAAGAAEASARAACSRSDHVTSPMRGGVALGASRHRANWSLERPVEERDMDDSPQERSPMRPLAGLPQRTQELCEELITLDSLVKVDEDFFSAQAAMESHVLELLRLWREAELAGDSRDGSRRPSGVYSAATASAPSADTQSGDAVNSSSGGGTQRVLQDCKEARDRIALLAELHEELAELEEQHCGLQRRYVVEKSPLSALHELCARLDEEDEEALVDDADTCSAEGAERAAVGTHRDARSKIRPRQGRDVARAGLAACRLLADRLHSRCTMISDRLTDELLWTRSEMARHEWAALQALTPLTQMDRVTSLDARDDNPITNTSASRTTSLFLPTGAVSAVRRGGKDSAGLAANSNANRFSEGVGSARDGDGSKSDRSAAATEPRESFVLRVHVPVFASATPPTLAASSADRSTFSEGSPDTTARGTPGASGDGLLSVGSAERMRRRSSGGAQAPSNGPTVTVSVIATPTRYALVQLYECCREGLAAMLTRLCTLRARRSREVELLRQEQSAMDVYDPAADDIAERCAVLLRYVEQLDEWSAEVLQMDQELHERVKLPSDAALQTYERLRTQLLEVLKQRLEDDEDHDKEQDVARADAEENGDEAVDRDDSNGELHAWQAEDGEGNGGGQRRVPGSVGDDRAHRGTQPPVKASSGAARPTALPRASAEFLVMLEELLQDQEAARKRLPATSPGFSGDMSCLERELDTDEHHRKGNQPSGEASVLERGPLAAEGLDEGASALTDVGATPEAEHLRIPFEAHSCVTISTVTTGNASASEAGDTNTGGPSVGVDASHLAGRRRQRDDGEDTTGGDPSHAALPDTAENKCAHLSDPAAADAPLCEMTVHVSSTSCSESGEVLVEGAESGQSVTHTEGEARRLLHVARDGRGDSNADASDFDVDDDSQSSGKGDNSAHTHQPQRYALGSGSGLGEGLRAFFSAVVRRAMNFDDSDDDADEAKGATPLQERQPGSTSPPPSHKRARRE
ncbi:hypothetical protein LSCM1_07853 [Leishmania martiniquensis]|uniref:Uncharacterized protein n=1 Tax=Leishmania martiniquensis TaxID=1580590 RepID=A0A836HXS3_9TRYP|nr:hypothetical protein LSCM1_07853 [Leishmania martiniquensis]